MGDRPADFDNIGGDPDRRQFPDLPDRDVMGLVRFMPNWGSHDPGATGEWGAGGAAFVECTERSRERTGNVDRSRGAHIHCIGPSVGSARKAGSAGINAPPPAGDRATPP